MFTNDSRQLINNKIMILYAIQSNGGQMRQLDLTDFFMSYDYMNFFELQQYLNELLDTQMLDLSSGKTGELLTITAGGLNSLKYFTERIEKSLRKEIDLRLEIARTKTVSAPSPEGKYLAQDGYDYAELTLSDDGRLLFYVKILVSDRQSAEVLISRWYDDYEVMALELNGWLQQV